MKPIQSTLALFTTYFRYVGQSMASGFERDIKIFIVVMMLYYVVVRLLPSSIWFNYYGLINESAKGSIEMISDRERKVATPIAFTDILFCSKNGYDFSYYSSQTNAGIIKSHKRKKILWTYAAPTPTSPRTCKIESTITATVDFGIQKRQTIETLPFNYQP